MARKQRMVYPGMYHIVNRGVERRNVFLEEEDYDVFLNITQEMLKQFNVTLHAYCLMTNHYHLLIETHEENISNAIKYLNAHYAIYFNKKYKRTGHLWQGRFLSYYLYDDTHFWIVAKYIERNPITANMVQEISQYKHQSFTQWKYGLGYKILLKNAIIFDMTVKEYETFIREEMGQNVLDEVYSTPKIVKKYGEFILLKKRLETFFEQDKDINRNENIRRAYEYGYSKTEIANLVGLSAKSVGKVLGVVLCLFLRSVLYFTQRYFFKFGFLDGKSGLVWHFLQGGWYRFLVDAKINEIYFKAKQLRSSDSETSDGDSKKKIILEILEREYGMKF